MNCINGHGVLWALLRKSVLAAVITLLSSALLAAPSVESYTQEAKISDMELSPNGEMIAFTLSDEGRRSIVVRALSGGVLRVFDASENLVDHFEFLGNDYLVIYKSENVFFPRYDGDYRVKYAFAANIESGETTTLLASGNELRWPQLNLSQVLGFSGGSNQVLMSALSGNAFDTYQRSIYRVNIETGRGIRIEPGHPNTIDWFVDESGTVQAREDYDNQGNRHSILVQDSDRWTRIWELDDVEIREGVFNGLSPKNDALLYVDDASLGYEAVYHLSLEDGTFSAPIFYKEGADISTLISSWSERVYGVQYTGLLPSYEFYDETLSADVAEVVSQWPMNALVISSISEDMSKVLFYVSGGDSSGMYLLLDRDTGELDFVADSRPDIPIDDVAPLATLTVTARDGIKIPTILTIPPGVGSPKNMPAILLPHGGPRAHDRISFDPMAQYFASLGYLVIQPNFRGSSGFGSNHTIAGRGEWGLKMQDDLTDTLNRLVELGAVDPNRVCIVGASYGGYAALAGGAFTPELYQCVVAIAGVSDLPEMLKDESREWGSDHWVVSYWNQVIGERGEDRDKLEQVSPINFAENFSAPVLLLHGDRDGVVPIEQSEQMDRALRRADKDVTFVELKDEDHDLSYFPTRLQAYELMGEFVQEHLDQ